MLDATRLAGGEAVVTFRRGVMPGDLAPEGASIAGGGRIMRVQSVSGGLVVRLAGLPPGAVPLPMADGSLACLDAAPEETTLFAGLDAALVLTNGEEAALIADWLAFHARHHGLEAALVLHRGTSEGCSSALAKDLASHVAARGPALARLVVLGASFPLGAADAVSEGHPLQAPDAPGKDRMTPPPADPFRAPFAEGAFFEAVRWRFLGRAAGVLALDLSDLLAPVPGASVFAAARNAGEGVVRLEGRRVYPWRLRDGQAGHFADHICQPFDATGGNRRWCIAPARAGGDVTWRHTRIGGVSDGQAPMWRFHRCMALRHPGVPVSRLVPKSSLVEVAELRELAAGFGRRPVRPPRSRVSLQGDGAAGAGKRTAIVTTMKNEGPFILEWIAYHRAIGIGDFVVYTNDCTDGTDSLLALLDGKGIVTHRENPFRATGLKPQHAALQAAESEAVVAGADWVICMDVDEFLCIHAGEGRLADLFAAVDGANMISVTWRLFGNSDVHAYEEGFVTERFLRCAPEFSRKPHQAWGFKTLFRNIGLYRKFGVHRPKGLRPDLWDQIRWVNGSGRPMPREMLRNGWRSTTRTYGYGLVSLNHYAVRSAESFLVKRDRGRVNHVDRDQGLNYWFRMNNNAEENRAILRMMPAMRAEFLRLLADPEIAAAHSACVAAHRSRIAQLRERADYAAFYRELTSPRMERLSRLHAQFGSAVFHAGPQVVPEDFLASGPPEDVFLTLGSDGGVRVIPLGAGKVPDATS